MFSRRMTESAWPDKATGDDPHCRDNDDFVQASRGWTGAARPCRAPKVRERREIMQSKQLELSGASQSVLVEDNNIDMLHRSNMHRRLHATGSPTREPFCRAAALLCPPCAGICL